MKSILEKKSFADIICSCLGVGRLYWLLGGFLGWFGGDLVVSDFLPCTEGFILYRLLYLTEEQRSSKMEFDCSGGLCVLVD